MTRREATVDVAPMPPSDRKAKASALGRQTGKPQPFAKPRDFLRLPQERSINEFNPRSLQAPPSARHATNS